LSKGITPDSTASALKEMKGKGIFVIDGIDPAMIDAMQLPFFRAPGKPLTINGYQSIIIIVCKK